MSVRDVILEALAGSFPRTLTRYCDAFRLRDRFIARRQQLLTTPVINEFAMWLPKRAGGATPSAGGRTRRHDRPERLCALDGRGGAPGDAAEAAGRQAASGVS
jgi:hypothetical protein